MTHHLSPITLRLRLVCAKRPPESYGGRPTSFGVLDKKKVVHPGTAGTDGATRFDLVVKVEPDGTDGVKLSGPFVHGTPAERFLYLGWCSLDSEDTWIRRWKISLTGIERAALDGLGANDGLALRVGETGIESVWLAGNGWTRFDADRDGAIV